MNRAATIARETDVNLLTHDGRVNVRIF